MRHDRCLERNLAPANTCAPASSARIMASMEGVYRSGLLPDPLNDLAPLTAAEVAAVAVVSATPGIPTGGAAAVCVWEGDEQTAVAQMAGLLAQDAIVVLDAAHAGVLEQAGVPAFKLHVLDRPQAIAQLHAIVADIQALTGEEIVWRGPFGRHSSLALVNSELAGQVQQITGSKVITAPRSAPAHPSAAVGVSHSWPPDFTPASGGPQIAILPWEYGDPPVEWAQEAQRHLDQVWVPSQYIRDGYTAGGMPPEVVKVVPNGIDLNLFCPDGPALAIDPRQEGRCVFLFVGGSIMRKGIDLVQQAWDRAFGPGDDVLLIIKDFGSDSYYRHYSRHEDLREWANRDGHAPVVVTDRHLAPQEMPQLYRAADVMLLPYRGEGFCLPALEAMACAVPIIHPASGPTGEFCHQGGWRIPADRFSMNGRIQIDLTGPGYLHEPDLDRLVQTMREVAADPQERARRGQLAAGEAQRMTWQRMGRIAADLIDRARRRTPVRLTDPAVLPERRATLIAATADWSAEEFASPLAQAVGAIPPDAPVTLACSCAAGEADAATDAIIAALEAHGIDVEGPLCDLTVVEEGDADWQGLVLSADAVLILDERIGDLTHARVTLRAQDVSRWLEGRLGVPAA